MGVKLLTSYVRRNEKIFYKDLVTLKDCHLVFDGDALLWALINNAPALSFAGDYNTLYYFFKYFFEKLKRLKVTPYLVFDGGLNIPLKNETICGRKENQIRNVKKLNNGVESRDLPRPLLSKMLFLEVLRDNGIKFAVAKGEADNLVAAVSNELTCPAVTNDSDFFLFDVQHGVIVLDTLLEVVNNSSSSTPRCTLYRREHLIMHLKIDVQLIHFIALFMGNDYSVDSTLAVIREKSNMEKSFSYGNANNIIQSIVVYLKEFNTPEEIINKLCEGDLTMETNLREQLDQYDLKLAAEECTTLINIIKESQVVSDISNIPDNLSFKEQLLTFNRYGLIDSLCLDIYFSSTHFTAIQCENISNKPSIEASRELMNSIYRVLLHAKGDRDQVSEFKRAGDMFRYAQISCHEENLPSDILVKTYCKKVKRNKLFELIGFPVKYRDDIDCETAIFIMSAYHWVHRCSESGLNVKLVQVEALLITFIICHNKREPKLYFERLHDMNICHQYCSFQSIFFYLVVLNTLLKNPFNNPSIRYLINGTYYHRICEKLEKGENPNKLLRKSEVAIFKIYFDIVSENTGDLLKKQIKQQPKKNATKITTKSLGNNRFAVLDLDEGSSDEESSDEESSDEESSDEESSDED